MKNWKVSVKLIVSFLIVIVLTAVLGGFSLYGIITINDADTYMYENSTVPLTYVAKITETIQRLRVSSRDYITASVTENDALVESSHSDIADFIKTLEEYLDKYEATIDNDEENKAFFTGHDIFEERYRGHLEEFYELAKKRDTNGIIDALNKATPDINEMVEAFDTCSDIMVQAATDTSNSNSATAGLMMTITIVVLAVSLVVALFLAFYISGLISKPLGRLTQLVSDVVDGNLNINMDRKNISKDEIGSLTLDVYSLVDVIRTIIDDLIKIAEEMDVKGDTDYRIDASAYKGSYKDMVDGINSLVGAFIEDIFDILHGLTGISNGNFDISIKSLPGKKAVINQRLDELTAALKSIYADMTSLVNSASDGKLNARVDPSKFKGGWSEILANLNNLLEAVVNPINEVNDVMAQVALGNFDLLVNGNYKGDFLKIKNSINNTVTNIASYIDEISSVLSRLAEDDLTLDITRDYVGKFSDIKNALLNIIAKFNEVISDIYSAADQVSAGSKQISESSMTLAQGATEQASSVEELSATIQTINQNTTQNAANAKEAEHLSDSSKANASKGNDNMQQMLQSMEGIKESSHNISKIIKVIEDIAFQTNLLALNAAVEAARAGEHGKGFAVVAEEVRNLASKSQASAKDTAELIEESINRVNQGAQITDETAEALQAILNDVTKVANIITDITNASEDQALAIGQVTEGVNQISTVVQSNSATSEESASASQQLASQADVLKGLVAVFKLKKHK